MIYPVLLLFSVLRSLHCFVCETQPARNSYACCLTPGDITSKDLTNCTFFSMQTECEAEQLEGTCEEGQFRTIVLENWKGVYCKGKRREGQDDAGVGWSPSIRTAPGGEDPSTYDNNTFLWSCSKPPPPAQQATVLLNPPPGNISVKSYGITLNLALERSFPQAYLWCWNIWWWNRVL